MMTTTTTVIPLNVTGMSFDDDKDDEDEFDNEAY